MSATCIEFLKIFFDKGLLAVVIGIAGYSLNKALEKFKASNTYNQRLSEARIQAYLETSKILADQVFLIRRILDDLNLLQNFIERRKDTEKAMKFYTETGKKYIDNFYEAAAICSKNLPFFSTELTSQLQKHALKLNAYSKQSQGVFPTREELLLEETTSFEQRLILQEESARELAENLSYIQDLMKQEINKNPFQ